MDLPKVHAFRVFLRFPVLSPTNDNRQSTAMASLPTLDGLPPEILLKIYELVEETHHETILALSLVNKYLRSLSDQFVFHTVYIALNPKFGDRATPTRNCHELLRQRDAFRHVRRLFVSDGAPKWHMGNDPNFHPKPFADVDAVEREDGRLFNMYACDNELIHFHCHLTNPIAAQDDTSEHVHQQNDSWRPMAALVGQLGLLAELHFSCTSQFPPCLLETLHQHLPRCKLFIKAFRLRSIGDASGPDSHEVQLVTSPNLHSVRMSLRKPPFIENPDAIGPPEEFPDISPRIISALAPNLAELEVHYHDLGRHVDEDPTPAWRALAAGKQASLRVLKLTSANFWQFDQEELRRWARITDLSSLEVLDLSCRRLDENMNHLFDYLRENATLSSLTTVHVTIDDEDGIQRRGLEEWLPSLPRLTSLFLTSLVELKTTPKISNQHLRTLCVRGHIMHAADIPSLEAQCPMLENLSIMVTRSEVDEADVDLSNLYQALGRLPRLRCLALTFFNGTPEYREADPSFDEFDLTPFHKASWIFGGYPTKPHLYGHLRMFFSTRATDATLARAIFDMISSSKRFHGSVPLHTLQIRSGQVPDLLHPEANIILRELCRSWRVQRWGGEINVTEIESPDHLQRGLRRSKSNKKWYGILERIWPRNGAEEWPWQWKSLPLVEPDLDAEMDVDEVMGETVEQAVEEDEEMDG